MTDSRAEESQSRGLRWDGGQNNAPPEIGTSCSLEPVNIPYEAKSVAGVMLKCLPVRIVEDLVGPWKQFLLSL